MWPQSAVAVCRHILQNYRQLPNLFERVLLPSLLPTVQQNRNLWVMKRRWPVPPTKLGKVRRTNKKSQLVYEVVENTRLNPPKRLRVILTEDVHNVGMKWDMIEMAKLEGRRLLRSQRAMYASPENVREMLEMRKEQEGEKRLSQFAHQTINLLQQEPVIVELHPEAQFDYIPKEQIIHGFKSCGVNVPEHALQMPEEPITKCGTYIVHVTINEIKTVPVEVEVKYQLTQQDIDRMNFEKLFD